MSFAAFGVTLVADLPLVDHFDGGSLGYALLTTLWGAGAIAGSWLASRMPARLERRSLVAGTALMAVSLGSIAVMPNLPAAILVGTVGGVGSGFAFTPWFSLLQRLTPDRDRGTAFAMAETFEQCSFIAGMVAAGAVVEAIGARPTYLVPGGLLAVATALAVHDARRERVGADIGQVEPQQGGGPGGLAVDGGGHHLAVVPLPPGERSLDPGD